VGLGALGWALLLVATRYMSLASIGAALVVPAAGWWLYRSQGMTLPIVLTLLGLMVVVRHHGNIRRLMAGTENRFQFRKKV
ncbi:MAG: glycerol-3-phosphate acyltransferase, partial [Kiritimatiellaeota bacterium]|nr:glycerol-3-phosphate acyltransferase [Kiritimatiellota bacterium]